MTAPALDASLPDPSAVPGGRLSGRTVGQLRTAEQFLIWALRQRLRDGAADSPVLLHGFRLAFGLGCVEPALVAFEALFATLAGAARADVCLCPLRCACVSADEELILGLVAQARCGVLPGSVERRAARLVGPAACARLAGQAEVLAALVDRAGLGGELH